MAYCAYVRVSTDNQTNENQRFEITNWCSKRGWTIDKWVADDGVSGAKDYKKRKLGQLMAELNDGDTLIACEISRFGRDLMMVMEILRHLMDKHIKVYTIKDNFTLSDEIQSKVIAFAFGLAAEIERKLIQQRTKAALDRLKAEGVRLGRPVGVGDKYTKLKGHEDEVISLLQDGTSKNDVARKFGINKATLLRFLRVSGRTDLVNDPPKRFEVSAKRLQELADKGYSLARAARTLRVSASTIDKKAKAYGIEFCDGRTGVDDVYAELDARKSEIVERYARGETYASIRKSLNVASTTWSYWLKRNGLNEIRTLEGAKAKRVEIFTLHTQGLSPRQISVALHIRKVLVKIVLGQMKETRSIRELTDAERAIATQNGISGSALSRRLISGWTVADAINTPPMQRGRRHDNGVL